MNQDVRALYTLGIATDLGLGKEGADPGADIGPRALFRSFALHLYLKQLGLHIDHPGDNILRPGDGVLPASAPTDKGPKLARIEKFSKRVAEHIEKDLDRLEDEHGDYRALLLGGDHSMSLGTYAGVANHFGRDLGVLWIDAHADLNTWATSGTKNVHGMILAAILGRTTEVDEVPGDEAPLFACCPTTHRPKPENVVILGLRAVDYPREFARMESLGIKYYTSTDVERRGIADVMEEILENFETRGLLGKVHVSFDLDSLDPCYAPGVSTPVSAGLTDRELFFIAERIDAKRLMCSLDIVEYNISKDLAGRTGRFAVEAALHFFGKRRGAVLD